MISAKQVTIFLVAVVLLAGLELFVNRTTLGVRIRAVSESLSTASLVGINPNRAIALIFFIGPGLGESRASCMPRSTAWRRLRWGS